MSSSLRLLTCKFTEGNVLCFVRNASYLSSHASVCTRAAPYTEDEVKQLPNPDTCTAQQYIAMYGKLLRGSGDEKALQDGMCAHNCIILQGLADDVFLQGLLVQMYGKCGSLDQALRLFNAMPERSPYSWNFIIRACAQQGQHGWSIELFYQLQQEGALPDKFTYVCVFTACGGKGDYLYSTRMHARIVETSIELDTGVGTAVVNMYGKCGRLNEAERSFDMMSERDVVSWNVLLGISSSQHDEGKQAFQRFSDMQQQGFLPTKVTFLTMLEACAVPSALNEGRRTHVCLLGLSSEVDAMVDNALINMYGKCDSLHHACVLFDEVRLRNVVTWSIIIALCVQHEQVELVFSFYCQMHQEGVLPERATLLAVLAACSGSSLLTTGERLIVFLNGIEDNMIRTEIVNMYGRCGSVNNACEVFDGMMSCDIVAWNTMISVYSQHGDDRKAFQLFERMLSEITPTSVTCVSLLGACIDVMEGRLLHAYITENGFEISVIMGNAVVNMYGKVGSIQDAWRTFIGMARRDVISWNAMVATYTWNGKLLEALALFEQMQHEGITPDNATHITILEAYGRCQKPGSDDLICCMAMDEECTQAGRSAVPDKLEKPVMLLNACKIFDRLQEPDVRAWNAMLDIYIQHGQGNGAFQLLDKMQWEGVFPNCDSFILLLSLCAAEKNRMEGKRIHCSIRERKLDTSFATGTALVSMYGNFDSLDDARRVFDSYTSKNVVLWTAMVSVYVQSWHGDEGLKLFHLMQQCGMAPNKITFISLLEACISQGALSEGKSLHACISSMGILSDTAVATVLIEMYSKCGRLKDGLVLFHRSPVRDRLLWNTMISLCSQHGLAAEAMELVEAMEEEGVKPDSVTFISILTVCSHCGLIGDALYWLHLIFPEYNMPTTRAHYVCMIDVLGRAGQLETAWCLASGMPFLPTEVPYITLLRACQQQADFMHGEVAAMHSFELSSGNAAPYVLLSNIHAIMTKQEHT